MYLKYKTQLHEVCRISLESFYCVQPAVFSIHFSLPFFFSCRRERDVEAETDMKPQCSCVVSSGILLTWDPLGGFGGVGGGECTTGLRKRERKKEGSEGLKISEENLA